MRQKRKLKRFFNNTHKECGKCEEIKVYSEFHKCKGTPTGLAHYCKKCAVQNARACYLRKKAKDPDYSRHNRWKYIERKYGITEDEFYELFVEQDSKCAICFIDLPEDGHMTHIDHCHNSGEVRGILCTNCNRGLGHFQDSIENLEQAAYYLHKHRKNK